MAVALTTLSLIIRRAVYSICILHAGSMVAQGHPNPHSGQDECHSLPTAYIRNGTVNGRYLAGFDQDLFLGIPFASAPRLANPTPLNDSWTTPFDASSYGPTCYGFGSNQLLPSIKDDQSEDCLNLNIVRPSCVNANAKLPVLMWIYGGGWSQGSSADPMWNMSYIVQTSVENGQPIIGVSINYRLSFLGFPSGTEALAAGVTNLGLKDQRIAMEWIQENIQAFGGDPQKVTIWGESAGAASVAFHLVANGGSGGAKLFRAAMMASGSVTGLEITKLGGSPSEQEQYEAMLKAANCSNASDGLECLRTAPINAIYEHENSTGAWEPVIDGDFIRREPALEMDDGNIARVPIMVGHNADEGLFVVNTLAGLLGFVPDNETQLREVIAQIQPTLDNSTIDRLLEAYPAHSPMPPYSLSIDYPWCPALRAVNLACGAEYRRLAAIFGDWFVDAGRRNMAEHWVKLGLPAYSYRFAANPTSLPIQVWIGLGPGFSIHGADLAYDFRLPGGFTTPIDFYPPVKNISSHEELSKVMADKFISFVHSLDPNAFSGDVAPKWKPYVDSCTNYVFSASDSSLLVHNEPDTYRTEGILIWIRHIQEAYYSVD